MKRSGRRYNRRSIRLKGYDYSQPGAYFVTICVQHSRHLLRPAPVRAMARFWWRALPERFPNAANDAFVIMPNHVHMLILINAPAPDAGAHATLGRMVAWYKSMTTNGYIRGVNEEGWEPFHGRLWQRGYYEQIVRNGRHLGAIRRYIGDNPAHWRAAGTGQVLVR